MTSHETGPASPEQEKKTSVKRMLLLVPVVMAGAYLLLGVGLWAAGAFKGYKKARAERAGTAPLLAQARKLGLTYEYAKAYPDKAPGKPALWCLRKIRGEAEAWYDGEAKKPLYLTNPEAMYDYAGSSHQDCVKTLIKIRSVKPLEFSPGKLRIEAEVVGYP